jgi:hypothetical protein
MVTIKITKPNGDNPSTPQIPSAPSAVRSQPVDDPITSIAWPPVGSEIQTRQSTRDRAFLATRLRAVLILPVLVRHASHSCSGSSRHESPLPRPFNHRARPVGGIHCYSISVLSKQFPNDSALCLFDLAYSTDMHTGMMNDLQVKLLACASSPPDRRQAISSLPAASLGSNWSIQ